MREKLIYVLGAVAALLLVRNLNIILNVLPDEANQGAMYRILFFHVPAWWTAGLAVMLWPEPAWPTCGRGSYGTTRSASQ